MKKSPRKSATRQVRERDADTMRSEYDFSKARRGVTAARYARGTNVILLDPDVLAVFPTSASVNAALRKLAGITRPAAKKK